MRLIICGFSGAGKSTIGAKVAAQLKIPFVDSDQELAAGVALSKRIEAWGWSEFRRLEGELILRLTSGLKGEKLVISLGGGALNEVTLAACKGKGNQLAWLNTPFAECWERIANDPSRPLTKNGEAEMAKLYQERLPLYQQANITVSGTTAVDELVAHMASFQ